MIIFSVSLDRVGNHDCKREEQTCHAYFRVRRHLSNEQRCVLLRFSELMVARWEACEKRRARTLERSRWHSSQLPRGLMRWRRLSGA